MTFVTKENTQDIYPLSPTQKGMLFHSLYDRTTPVYFEQLAFTINGPLDVKAFKSAWDHLIDMNPIFRTVFKWAKVKDLIQIVLKKLPFNLLVHDISEISTEDQNKKIETFLEKDMAKPFDMEEGPLIRLNLFRLGKDKHYFIWSYHHIILDGWCLSIVMKDLFESYMALIAGNPLPRPARRPYRDYIAWYRKQDKENASSFWKELLHDFSAPTPLPVDIKIGQKDGPTIAEESVVLSETETSLLQEVAKKERITQSSLLQAVWAILLSYYANSDDVVFGATVSGRPADLRGSEDMLGLFINTLPMRVRYNKETTISELLQLVQKQSVATRKYEYSFLPDIKDLSSVPKNQNLFESIVVFENYPLDSFLMGEENGFGISDIKANEMTNFAISLVIAPGKCLSIRFQYSEDLFEQRTIKQMTGHMHEILKAISDDPDRKVSELSVLTQAEKELILTSFNDTYKSYPLENTVYQIIEAQANKTPNGVAVTFEERSLTYKELNKKANQLAMCLRDFGVGKEVMVTLMLDRSVEMELALLGVMKSGGAYVPMGTDYPDSRVEYILGDTLSPIVLTQEKHAHKFSGKDLRVLCLDSEWDKIEKFDTINPEPWSGPENLAYVLYTSGSTGIPKGVACIHKGLCNRLVWMQDEYGLNHEDCVLQKTPYTFDVSGWEFFWPLMYGARLHFLKPEGHKDPFHIMDVIRKEHVTTLHFVPSMLGGFLQVVDDNNKKELVSLKRVICSGEALMADHRNLFFKYLESDLHNLYGPTEASIDVTYYACRPEHTANTIPIGRAIANTQIYILDRYMRPVPMGIAGEVFLAGVNLAREYVNKPEKTAEAFIKNSISPDGRLYRTGDLGKWLPDGNIEYLGRIDHQVKIRGNRIELGEVESVLSKLEGVHDCVVVDRDDGTAGKYLVGYYAADAEISVTIIRDFLNQNLPEYMVPSRFMRLEILPLSPNGKVDRKALPEVDDVRPDMASEYVAPRSDLEQILVQAWQKSLGIDKIGVFDNFFDLGGDSIISLQVVGNLKKQGYEIQPKDIFELQTIAELVPVVKEFKIIEAEQGPVSGEAPLSPIQSWFFDLDLANKNHFNQSLIFKTAATIDKNALKKSLKALFDHHDVLRTRFVNSNQEFMPLDSEVLFYNKDVNDETELEQEVNRLQTSFDITRGPVFGAGLYHLKGINYIIFAGHHLVLDGVSWRILLEDLADAYSSILGHGEIVLPPKTTSYKEWTTRLIEYADKDQVVEEVAFWEDELSKSDTNIIVDHDLGPNDIASSTILKFVLGEEETNSLLRDANRSFNTDVNDLLLTALMRALQTWTGQDQVQFDLEGHGREDVMEDVDISRTVGWFTTLYPVVLNIGSNEKLDSQTKKVKEKLRSIPFKGFNFGVLKYSNQNKHFRGKRGGVLFNYLGQINTSELDGFFELTDDVRALPSDPENERSHLVDINCKVEEGRLLIDMGYSRNKYMDDSINKLGREFVAEIENVVQYCMELDNAGYTPSDFELTDLSQDQLDDLADDLDDI